MSEELLAKFHTFILFAHKGRCLTQNGAPIAREVRSICLDLVVKGRRSFSLRSRSLSKMWKEITFLGDVYNFPRSHEGQVCRLLYVHLKRKMEINENIPPLSFPF